MMLKKLYIFSRGIYIVQCFKECILYKMYFLICYFINVFEFFYMVLQTFWTLYSVVFSNTILLSTWGSGLYKTYFLLVWHIWGVVQWWGGNGLWIVVNSRVWYFYCAIGKVNRNTVFVKKNAIQRWSSPISSNVNCPHTIFHKTVSLPSAKWNLCSQWGSPYQYDHWVG
jgi:hypothetical protein